MNPLPQASPIGVTTSSRTTQGSNCSTTSATESTGRLLPAVEEGALAPLAALAGKGLLTSGGAIFLAELGGAESAAAAEATGAMADFPDSISEPALPASDTDSFFTAPTSAAEDCLALAGLLFEFPGLVGAAGALAGVTLACGCSSTRGRKTMTTTRNV